MINEFFERNKSTLIVLLVLVLIWGCLYWFGNDDRTETYLNTPETGDIYVFGDEGQYAPMRLDSLTVNAIYMRNYLYAFAHEVPKVEQIIQEEFDTGFYAIFDPQELKLQFEKGKIAVIYRP